MNVLSDTQTAASSAGFQSSPKGGKLVTFFERYRKPLSFLAGFVYLAALLFTDTHHALWQHIAYDAIGITMIALAALGRVWCALYIAGRKNSQLTVDGPYSMVRNPLYFFSFLGLVGIGVFAHLPALALLSVPVFLIYYHYVIGAEELRLLRLFGDSYLEYYRKTPRFWPNPKLFHTRESFSIEPVRITRAMMEVVWFLLSLAMLEFIEQLHESGIVSILYYWPF